MPAFVEQLRGLEIETDSPQGAATVSISKERGLRIRLDSQLCHELGVTALAEDVCEGIQEARTEYSLALHEFKLEQRPRSSDRKLPPAMEQRRTRYLDQIADIECVANSSRGLVKVSTYGDGDLLVWIAPRALNYMDILPKELGDAATAAIQARSQKLQDAHRDVYGATESRRRT